MDTTAKFAKFFILGLTIFIFINLNSCGKDEPSPLRESESATNRPPDYPGDNESPDEDSLPEESESAQAIIGTWANDSEGLRFTFESDGSFTARVIRKLGFHVDGSGEVSGTYRYSDYYRFIWLSVQGEGEVYPLEFKCIIDGDIMELTGQSGTGTHKLKKI